MNASFEATLSLWMARQPLIVRPRLKGELSCDTVIVGAGIAGLSVAYELAEAGHKVVVLDRGPIPGGMTARTTAHLAPICDDGLSALKKMRGATAAAVFQESQTAAVARIEAIVAARGIACNFRRLDAFLFPAPGMDFAEARKLLDEEREVAREIGAAAERVTGVPLQGFEKAPVLRFAEQATFHPLRYIRGLVAAIEAKGGAIFTDSPVTGVEEDEKGAHVTLESGSVTAAQAVVATNSPINDKAALHSKMAPYRTYAMAFTLPRGALPDALYWDMADPYHYVRLNPGPGTTDYLIAGGADHKTGEADDGEVRFEAIEAWVRALVPKLGRQVHCWSGQVLDTIDYCGFIGRSPGSKRIYVATGDSGQGMTHGALAGLLVKDLIVTGDSPWREVYEPSRSPPFAQAVGNYVKGNVSSIKSLAEYILPAEARSVDELEPGSGGVIRDGPGKIAACRDREGKLHLCSPVCTHAGCQVRWNSTEQCWDCPCHGSQFAPDGAVLNGPAIEPLAPATLRASQAREAKSAKSRRG
jgi:glycine/D-amino acid oxidase-like deaminating enzyme/nitrite reductase/ring-hydroxylating ferredoxin subunit